jgi:hypothetical protein
MSDTRFRAIRARMRHRQTSRLWSSDWSLTVLLVLLLANIFALPILFSDLWGRLASRAILSLAIISGLAATVHSRRLILLGWAFTLIGFLVGWEDAAHPDFRLRLLNDVSALILLGLMIVLIVRQVFREGPITMHRVRGSVALYLLIGLVWAIAYDLIEVVQPGSFGVAAGFHGSGLAALGYYSFTTLTTLGVGDVLPVSPVARSLTLLEALIGQLFPAILIARLVSMEITYRGHRTGSDGDKE